MARSKKSNRLDGCTFTLVVGMIMTALYVANGILVRTILIPENGPIDNRIVQPLQFGLPIVMVFFEYWLFDRFVRRFSSTRRTR